jgi:hypothetical protein
MGLIRKSALQEIGGWDEWCITEDAEASLRILKLGYDSIYIKKSHGHGLMPYTFEGLKKQRFRWCFGGIQILKKHWNALMPWARRLDPNNHLTSAQRYFYLIGGLQWFTDVLNLVFGVFLALGALASVFYGLFSVRPLTGPLLVMPAVFLFLHLWRFLWVLRKALHLPARIALRSMYNFFSLGWAVTLACVQGLIRQRGVFLRTPKSRGHSKVFGALRVAQWESLIGLLFLGSGLVAFIVRPELKTFWLGFLLAWQASLFLAAPYYSLLSIKVPASQSMLPPDVDRGVAVAENTAAKWAWATLAAMVVVVWAVFQIPQPDQLPAYAVLQPADLPPEVLFNIDTPTPTPTSTPGITPSPTAENTSTSVPTASSAPPRTPMPGSTATSPAVTPTASSTPTP